MNIKCSGCAKAYRINDAQIHKIYNKNVLCTDCGKQIPIDRFVLDKKALNQFTSRETLKQEVIGDLKKLYPMPHIILKARKLIAGNGSFKSLGNLLNTDPALASRVLKIANSSYYGMSGKVSSMQMAATVLGSKTLLQIITLIGHSKMLGGSLEGYGLNSGELWKHSLAVAVCSGLIVQKLQTGDKEDAFLTGLMHDSGKIILNAYVLERQDLFKRYTDLTRAPIHAAEKKILGFDHADIGYELCRKWNLPEQMATAIKDHHAPASPVGNRDAFVIRLANHMARKTVQPMDETSTPPLDALRFLQITEYELGDLISEATLAVETLEENTY